MSIITVGLSNLEKDVEKEVDKFAEKTTRANALDSIGKVKLATPVDTGAARNSWYIGYKESYYDESKGDTNPQSNINILEPKDKPQKIFVTNGVEYIKELNEGNSKQAPQKFIESVFEENFESVTVDYVQKT